MHAGVGPKLWFGCATSSSLFSRDCPGDHMCFIAFKASAHLRSVDADGVRTLSVHRFLERVNVAGRDRLVALHYARDTDGDRLLDPTLAQGRTHPKQGKCRDVIAARLELVARGVRGALVFVCAEVVLPCARATTMLRSPSDTITYTRGLQHVQYSAAAAVDRRIEGCLWHQCPGQGYLCTSFVVLTPVRHVAFEAYTPGCHDVIESSLS